MKPSNINLPASGQRYGGKKSERPLKKVPFCPIAGFGKNNNLQNTQCMDACPDGFFIGAVNPPEFGGGLTFLPALVLSKNEHFSKVFA